MPIMKCTNQGKVGLKYGKGGKCYTGKDAKEKAHKQGQAIEISKHAKTPAAKKAEAEYRRTHRQSKT